MEKYKFIGDLYFNGEIIKYDYVAFTSAKNISEARRNIGFNAKKRFNAKQHTIVDLVGDIFPIKKTEYDYTQLTFNL